jgi:hypothetical protein
VKEAVRLVRINERCPAFYREMSNLDKNGHAETPASICDHSVVCSASKKFTKNFSPANGGARA